MAKEEDKQADELITLLRGASKEDRELVRRAYEFARAAHEDQRRLSGKPYFSHTLQTARYLAELGMDATSVTAGLLHDTIEEDRTTAQKIRDEFGPEVLFLVEGVTKLGKLKYQGLERHAESLRKLFVAMARDIRVIIIRLADRLHNVETLEHLPEEKQRRVALETLEIYAPLANRLGIGKLKGALEDLAFPYVNPEAYEETLKLQKSRSRDHLKMLEKIDRALKRMLAEEKVQIVSSDKRLKHLYSFYQKLKRKDMNVEKVYDIAALRVIVPSVEDCYRTLGIIHARWKPLPGRIKDYIASPKPNGYRSLHTTIFTGDGGVVEIQIRTPEMHEQAEYGVASHVSYKEGAGDENQLWILRLLKLPFKKRESDAAKRGAASVDTPPWLEYLSKVQRNIEDPKEFLETLKEDFFDDRVFVFTPKGEVIDLPIGATPIDFAYAIHTDLGDHVAGAKINGKLSAIGTKLENGDIIEIVTKERAHPTRKWLDYAKTTLARRHIRTLLKQ